jgi:hypothetical protein
VADREREGTRKTSLSPDLTTNNISYDGRFGHRQNYWQVKVTEAVPVGPALVKSGSAEVIL